MKTKRSIFRRILIPLILVQVLQVGLFAALLSQGGVMTRLDTNAEEILSERVINRANYLENEMIQRWSNFTGVQQQLLTEIGSQLTAAQALPSDLTLGSELTVNVLKAVAPDLIALLRKNTVNGVFLILDGPEDRINEDGLIEKSGVFIRDQDPLYNPYDYSDLLMERSPTEVAQNLNIAMDIYWSPRFTLSDQDLYYFNPLNEAKQHPEIENEDLGYWGKEMMLNHDTLSFITYSQPLRAEDGTVLGVLGVSIASDYLKTLMPSKELLQDKSGAYLLGVMPASEDTLEVQKVTYSGGAFIGMFGETDTLTFTPADQRDMLVKTYSEKLDEKIYGRLQKLELYNTNTPFSDQQWVLIGLESKDSLYGFSGRIQSSMLLFIGLSLLFGFIAILYVSIKVSHQIGSLSRKVRSSDPHKPIHLDPIRITEIDQLSQSIEQLSHSVAESSSRLSQIISMLSIRIGAFECEKIGSDVFCTEGFFEVMNLENESGESQMLTHDEFTELMSQFDLNPLDETRPTQERVLKIMTGGNMLRWVRMKTARRQNSLLGVVQDVTAEILEKHRIEYERDYDVLTNLLNRRAFHRYASETFADEKALGVTAFMMLDLDNLKYINDTYGHDCGDEYIRSAANVLRNNTTDHELTARMSGDEFYMMFSGYANEFPIRRNIEKIRREMDETLVTLPDGNRMKLRASYGVAWYPKDTLNLEELIKYADFAMYEIKNSVKGGIKDFEQESYRKDSYLLHSSEELNQLIEGRLVDYAFQPIIDVRKARLFGYEALMRPKMTNLKTPTEVLRLARVQSRLYQIEKLTWFKVFETVDRYSEYFKDCKIFVNSIASQRLSEEDLVEFDQRFAKYHSQVVIELTESEKMDTDATRRKKERCRDHSQEIALDDFGTGYNGDAMLLELMPNYVKVDMSIIRGIDKDQNRREFYEGLVSYFRSRNIRILAEGVETREEMEVLVACGTELMQGFYFAKGALIPPLPDPAAMAALRETLNQKENPDN